MDQPEPALRIGQRVEAILNERNHTPHIGRIREVIWHSKDRQYHYYLEENGKKVSKRYSVADLRSLG
jgi:hypothetical protein